MFRTRGARQQFLGYILPNLHTSYRSEEKATSQGPRAQSLWVIVSWPWMVNLLATPQLCWHCVKTEPACILSHAYCGLLTKATEKGIALILRAAVRPPPLDLSSHSPRNPGGPLSPGGPFSPECPGSPASPRGPGWAPRTSPGIPLSPGGPAGPGSPMGPGSPSGPGRPETPLDPRGPMNPETKQGWYL